MTSLTAPMALQDLRVWKLCERESSDKSITHGTRSGYNAGCRGPMCSFANSVRRSEGDYDDLMEYITVTFWIRDHPGVDIAKAPQSIMRMYLKAERAAILRSA